MSTNHGAPEIRFSTILNRYRFGQMIGSGAFSHVYKVEDAASGKLFAIKVFPKSNLEGEDDVARFQREVDAQALMKHENIVSLNDFFSDNNNYYLVMDYCKNGELMNYIAKNGKINEPNAALIFQQIVSAVEFCHSLGVAHRDLKPENILFDDFPHVKLTDFGFCGYVNESKLMNTFCGSPCYSAPECLYHRDYDGKLSDMWSLGVVLYLMVVGRHPWDINNVNMMLKNIVNCNYMVPDGVSEDCRDLIQKLIVCDPQDRMTANSILQHPWLKYGAKAKLYRKSGRKNSLPPLPQAQSKSLEEIVAASRPRVPPVDKSVVPPLPLITRPRSDSNAGRNSSSRNFGLLGSTMKLSAPASRLGARRQSSVDSRSATSTKATTLI